METWLAVKEKLYDALIVSGMIAGISILMTLSVGIPLLAFKGLTVAICH